MNPRWWKLNMIMMITTFKNNNSSLFFSYPRGNLRVVFPKRGTKGKSLMNNKGGVVVVVVEKRLYKKWRELREKDENSVMRLLRRRYESVMETKEGRKTNEKWVECIKDGMKGKRRGSVKWNNEREREIERGEGNEEG